MLTCHVELFELYPLLDYASNYLFWHIESIRIRDPLWLLFANSAGAHSLYTLRELQARNATLSALSPLQFALEQLPTPDAMSLISRFHSHDYDLNETWSSFTCGRPLQHCCANAKDPGKLRAAFLLLDLGVKPSLPVHPFKSNIVRALENEAWKLYDRLLHHPMTRANDRDHQNKGLLHHLVPTGSMLRISELIDTLHDVDVNIQDENGYTPVHVAILANKVEVVRELLRIPGIRLEFTDRAGRTPLSTATYWGMKKMALVLIEHSGAFTAVDGDRSSPLIAAAIHGDQVICMRLLESCHYKNIGSQKDVSGKRLLHHLAKNEWPSMITDCLRLAYPPMSVDAIDHSGRSALHYAAILGNTESCRALLSEGASLKLQDRIGMTAAQVAADSGFKDTLMLLLRTGGVDANQKDHLGRNLVHWVATLDCLEIVHELSWQEDIRWTQKDKYGQKPVDIAYICRSKYVGQFLAQKTPDARSYDWESMYNSPFVEPPPETDDFEPHVFGMSVEVNHDVDDIGDDNPVETNPLPITRRERYETRNLRDTVGRYLHRSLSLNRDMSWERFQLFDDEPSPYRRIYRRQSMSPGRRLRHDRFMYQDSIRFWDESMRWDKSMCWERSSEEDSGSRSRSTSPSTRRGRSRPSIKRSKSLEAIVNWDAMMHRHLTGVGFPARGIASAWTCRPRQEYGEKPEPEFID